MNKTLLILFSLIFLIACNLKETEQQKTQITVSILPQKFLIEKIAPGRFNINVMIPPGASPATYDPTPQQMKDLSESVIYFRIGYIGFEIAWINNIQQTNKDLNIVEPPNDLELISEKAHSHEDHIHEGGIDPHIWLSPRSVEKIIRTIYNELIRIDPENKSSFEDKYHKFLSEIQDLNKIITESLQNLKNRKFLIFHPALTYYARDYDLIQIPMELEGKNPTPEHLKEIIDIANRDSIRVILIQKQFDKENAVTVAKEIDGIIIQIDPLSYEWLDNMEDITKPLKEALTL